MGLIRHASHVLSFTAKSAVGACDDLKDGRDHKIVLQIARASGRFRSTQRSRRHHLLLNADLWYRGCFWWATALPAPLAYTQHYRPMDERLIIPIKVAAVAVEEDLAVVAF